MTEVVNRVFLRLRKSTENSQFYNRVEVSSKFLTNETFFESLESLTLSFSKAVKREVTKIDERAETLRSFQIFTSRLIWSQAVKHI